MSSISLPEEQAFQEVLDLIRASRNRALVAVNSAIIDLYWKVGEIVARKIHTDGWGKGTVAALSATFRSGTRVCTGSPHRTSGECDNSSTRTGTDQISQRC